MGGVRRREAERGRRLGATRNTKGGARAEGLRGWRRGRITREGAADDGVSAALYRRDPDQNGVGRDWGRPHGQWPRDAQGGLAMMTERLDLEDLLKA